MISGQITREDPQYNSKHNTAYTCTISGYFDLWTLYVERATLRALKWRETKLINSHQNTTTCIIPGTTIYYSTNHKVSISICTQQSGHAGKSQGNHKRGRTNTHTCTLFQSTTYYNYIYIITHPIP